MTRATSFVAIVALLTGCGGATDTTGSATGEGGTSGGETTGGTSSLGTGSDPSFDGGYANGTSSASSSGSAGAGPTTTGSTGLASPTATGGMLDASIADASPLDSSPFDSSSIEASLLEASSGYALDTGSGCGEINSSYGYCVADCGGPVVPTIPFACGMPSCPVGTKSVAHCPQVGMACGGTDGTTCPPGLYCDSGLTGCGAEGHCEPLRSLDGCDGFQNYACGCDGHLYFGACSAANSGVSLSPFGGCQPPQGFIDCGQQPCHLGSTYCSIFSNREPGAQRTCEMLPPSCALTDGPPDCSCFTNLGSSCSCEVKNGGVVVTCSQ
jgi:hypothetical protein